MNSNLQGALGKISGRSYKAAPRQMLQVDSSGVAPSPTLANASPVKKSQEDHDKLTKAAGKLGREAMNVGEVGETFAPKLFVLTEVLVWPSDRGRDSSATTQPSTDPGRYRETVR